MKIKLVPPSVRVEPLENATISYMETGQAKIDAVLSNYLNATASALSSIGTLSFPSKIADFRRLTAENPWMREVIERDGAIIGLTKRQQGNTVPVGAFEVRNVWALLDSVRISDAPKAENAEEVEI